MSEGGRVSNMEIEATKHTGRFPQMIIYLGKLFRMFVFQNDWKVLPMSAIIAGLVSFAVGDSLFKTMEGTLMGTFALACVCIWNGFFNSIQVVCRERAIIKREHRSGLHISSYIVAHVIYQAVLCMAQSAITIVVLYYTKVTLPDKPLITGLAIVDLWLTIFLVTFCADMMALMVSAFVHTTTTAMTIMPFLLIFQLVFSGGFFQLQGTQVGQRIVSSPGAAVFIAPVGSDVAPGFQPAESGVKCRFLQFQLIIAERCDFLADLVTVSVIPGKAFQNDGVGISSQQIR